jgi:prolyl-tRNA editing enzyme YbaK/EbsC (Cys-tRNA(Pro) deacylase)
MKFGKLFFEPVEMRPDLVAEPTTRLVKDLELQNVLVSEIDGSLADTAAFCEHYDIGMDVSANCVIVEAKRGENVWYAACIVLATTRADINGIVRRHLNARKISFAPMDKATSLTGMMYGGITPIGLPADWPIIVDTRVDATDKIIIGSGLRKSKILVPGKLLSALPNAVVLDIVKE